MFTELKNNISMLNFLSDAAGATTDNFTLTEPLSHWEGPRKIPVKCPFHLVNRKSCQMCTWVFPSTSHTGIPQPCSTLASVLFCQFFFLAINQRTDHWEYSVQRPAESRASFKRTEETELPTQAAAYSVEKNRVDIQHRSQVNSHLGWVRLFCFSQCGFW